jgi:hypothetical protein
MPHKESSTALDLEGSGTGLYERSVFQAMHRVGGSTRVPVLQRKQYF